MTIESSQKPVLVVEDDIFISELVISFLTQERFNVQKADDGLQALTYLESLKDPDLYPSLILLDMRMPIMDGFEFLEKKSQLEKASDIPVIVVTASEYPEKYRSLPGIAGDLAKPFDLDELLITVERYCNRTSFKSLAAACV